MQNKHSYKLGNASESLDKFKVATSIAIGSIYIEVGVFKTHVRLMNLGSLDKCNHKKYAILDHSL